MNMFHKMCLLDKIGAFSLALGDPWNQEDSVDSLNKFCKKLNNVIKIKS